MCTENHQVLKTTSPRWPSLKLIGRQVTEADEYGPREVLELRDCPCGSTLSKKIDE